MQRLDDIHQAFVVFLEENGEVWAPILSQWTLQLLGQLSKEYSNRLAFAHSKGVNEIIQVWMGSKAIQSLLDLTSRCLTCRDHANADTFISALLGFFDFDYDKDLGRSKEGGNLFFIMYF